MEPASSLYSRPLGSVHKCVCVCAHRAKAVAVQTVTMMVALNPEVTIRDSDITILVAQSPAVGREGVLTTPPGGVSAPGGGASYLMKSPSRPMTRLMIFCWGFLGDLEGQKKPQT